MLIGESLPSKCRTGSVDIQPESRLWSSTTQQAMPIFSERGCNFARFAVVLQNAGFDFRESGLSLVIANGGRGPHRRRWTGKHRYINKKGHRVLSVTHVCAGLTGLEPAASCVTGRTGRSHVVIVS